MPLLLRRSFSGTQFRSFPNHVPSKRIPHTAPSKPIKEDQANRYSQSSPFDTLPVELQVEIFSHCLPPFPTFNADQAPLSIARVCYAWRLLVFETPKLWSSFEIQIKGSGPAVLSPDVRLMNTVKLWLLRSKQYPLNIRMTHTPFIGVNESHRSGEILALLMIEVHRWKHIEFIMPSANIYVLQRALPKDLPALRSLTLRTSGGFGSGGFVNFSLKHVPWRQITCLDLQFEQALLNIDQCLKILSQTEHLVECSFNLDCIMVRHDVPLEIVSLPSLEALRINVQRGTTRAEACLSRFLNTLSAPNLRTLHLGWSVYMKRRSSSSPSPSPSVFSSFLHRSAGTLRELTIAYLPLSGEELRRYLVQLPNITHLTLKYPLNDAREDPVTDAFLSACAFPPPPSSSDTSDLSKALLPMMEHCSIECHGQAYTFAALVAFVELRKAIYQKTDDSVHVQRGVMKSFHMLSMKVVLDAVDSRVRQWRNDGMDITIESLAVR